MPPVVGALGALATAVGGAVSSAVAGLSIAGVIEGIAGLAVSVGLSYIASLLLAPEQPKPSDQQQELRQDLPERQMHYGRVNVSGPVLFWESRKLTPDSDRPTLFKIVAISTREIDAYEELYLDDQIITLDADGNVEGDQFNYGDTAATIASIPIKSIVNIKLYTGTDDQAADPLLMEIFPEWTEDFRLRGIAYARIICRGSTAEKFNANYPNGEPTFKTLIRASKVCDPRDAGQDPADKSTWAWSDNATLCALDWLTHVDGYNRPLAEIDLDSFSTKADLDDELVPLKDTGTEKRWRVATTVMLYSEKRTDVLKRILEAGDGRLFPNSSGMIAIRGGKWTAPTVVIDSDSGHIIEAEFSDGAGALDRYNRLDLKYMSPEHGYIEVDSDPWDSGDLATLLAEYHSIVGDAPYDATVAQSLGLVIESRPYDLFQVPSHAQARRRAKIRMAWDNPAWMVNVRTNFYGLDAIGEECITLRFSELDIDLPFWIESDLQFLEDGTGMGMRLRAADPTAYDWDPDTEEGTAPTVPPDITSEFDPGEPPDIAEDFTVAGGVGEATGSATAPNDPAFYVMRFWRVATGGGYALATDISGPRLGAPEQEIDFTDPAAVGTYDYFVTTETQAGAAARSDPVGPITVTIT
jgi:hypothetical protein